MMAEAFASGKHALAECDICGFTYAYGALKFLVRNGVKTGIKVCPTCWNPDHPQYFVNKVDVSDPQGLRDPRPPGNLEKQREVIWSPEADIVLGKKAYP
jgi:hypothetical protein